MKEKKTKALFQAGISKHILRGNRDLRNIWTHAAQVGDHLNYKAQAQTQIGAQYRKKTALMKHEDGSLERDPLMR